MILMNSKMDKRVEDLVREIYPWSLDYLTDYDFKSRLVNKSRCIFFNEGDAVYNGPNIIFRHNDLGEVSISTCDKYVNNNLYYLDIQLPDMFNYANYKFTIEDGMINVIGSCNIPRDYDPIDKVFDELYLIRELQNLIAIDESSCIDESSYNFMARLAIHMHPLDLSAIQYFIPINGVSTDTIFKYRISRSTGVNTSLFIYNYEDSLEIRNSCNSLREKIIDKFKRDKKTVEIVSGGRTKKVKEALELLR